MINTVYDEISFRAALNDILSDRCTLRFLKDNKYHVLLSIYYQNKKMIEFCFCIRNRVIASYDLYKEKCDFI